MHSDGALDCLVAGGGVSGCYAAWKVAAACPGAMVALIERDSRLGGRLLSAPVCADGSRIDFGAMRYRTVQVKTRTLIEDVLNISVRKLPLGKGNRLYFLRGRLLDDRAFEAGPQAASPYRLPQVTAGLSPPQLLYRAIETVLSATTGQAPESAGPRASIDGAAYFKGRPLRDWDFWNLMHSVLSTEGYYFVLDGAGIGNGTVGRWNASEAIPWFLDEFAPGSEYRVINGGFDYVTESLAKEFQAYGGEVLRHHELQRVELADSSGRLLRAVIKDGEKEKSLLTKRLILALPPAALNELARKSPLLQTITPLVQSVTAQSLTRLILRYPAPWWRARQSELSWLLTDLPVRQVTFGVEPAVENGARAEESFVLCSFNDVRYPHFWSSLMDASTSGRGASTAAPIELAAHAPVIEEAHRQISQALDLGNAPAPTGGWCVEWHHSPYGGGWHTWNANTHPAEVIESLHQPLPSLPLHICGEAYSTCQAWVEGSLMSVDGLLQKILSLPGIEQGTGTFLSKERLIRVHA